MVCFAIVFGNSLTEGECNVGNLVSAGLAMSYAKATGSQQEIPYL